MCTYKYTYIAVSLYPLPHQLGNFPHMKSSCTVELHYSHVVRQQQKLDYNEVVIIAKLTHLGPFSTFLLTLD